MTIWQIYGWKHITNLLIEEKMLRKNGKFNHLDDAPEVKPSDNPYLDNQRGYLERLNAERATTATWKHITWFCCFIAFTAVCGLIYVGSQVDIRALVFMKDGSGGLTAVGIAGQPLKVTDAERSAQARRFVIAMEQVPSSQALRQDNVNQVVNLSSEQAFTEKFMPMLKQKYKTVGNGEVLVTVDNVVYMDNNSWIIDWSETLNGKQNGTFRGKLSMEALPKEYKQTTEQMLYNPIRMIVTDFTFNENVGAKE